MLLLAHRGLPGPGRPENSAEAVAAARAAGADGCEVDLRLTVDGVLVASHDEDLARLGSPGLCVSRTPARALPLARLPELVEAVDGGRLVLELKRPPSAPGRTVLALAGALRSLRRRGAGLDVTVSSFDPALIAAVRGLPVRTALLGGRVAGPRALVGLAVAAGHDEVHPHVSTLLPDLEAVGRAAAEGLAVVPWTVDAPADVRRLTRAGVGAVITDTCPLLAAEPALRAG